MLGPRCTEGAIALRLTGPLLLCLALAGVRGDRREPQRDTARGGSSQCQTSAGEATLSDELVIGCQRGEPWAIAELDRLVRDNLSPDEVNELLGNMLKDLDQRDEVIKKALADSKAELEDHKKSLVEYEKELVDLQNAADAAQMKATNQNLLRQKLNGEKTNAAEAYEQEHAEYVVVAPPADRTIYVLKVIMAKINEYCAHGTISTVAGR